MNFVPRQLLHFRTLRQFSLLLDRKVCTLFLQVSSRDNDHKKEFSLSYDQRRAYITTEIASLSELGLAHLFDLSSTKTSEFMFLEFPNIMLAFLFLFLRIYSWCGKNTSFPSSSGSCQLKKERTWIISVIFHPRSMSGRSGLSFLSSLFWRIPPRHSIWIRHWLSVIIFWYNKVYEQTHFDHSQCKALIVALCRECSFVQGPPGTGTSFLGGGVMKVLLALCKQAQLGPIAVVCYTNHALD